jgi:hypothetical protein
MRVYRGSVQRSFLYPSLLGDGFEATYSLSLLQYVLLRAIEIQRALEREREIALHIPASSPPTIVL